MTEQLTNIIFSYVPAISVIMSVYNGEHYLSEAIDSILNQTFKDFELLIVNDCSNDKTFDILNKYANLDKRIHVLTNEKNIGLAASLNRMIGQAKADLIARADCDDINFPNRLEKQYKFLKAHPDVGIISSWYNVLNVNNGNIFVSKLPIDDSTLKLRLLWDSPFAHPAVMIRKELISNQGYNTQFWCGQDYELWSRIAEVTKFANVPEVLLTYRQHDQAVSKTKGIQGEMLIANVVKKNLNKVLNKSIDYEIALTFRNLMKGKKCYANDYVYDAIYNAKKILYNKERFLTESITWYRKILANKLFIQAQFWLLDNKITFIILLSQAFLVSPTVFIKKFCMGIYKKYYLSLFKDKQFDCF